MLDFFVWAMFASLLIAPHELPDGVIDRSLQIDVRAEEVRVTMSVGLNDTTISDELTRVEFGELEAEITGRLDQYQQWTAQHVAEHLHLQVDGVDIDFGDITTELSSRHHVRFFVHAKASLPPGESNRSIKVVDECITNLQTQLRMAARGRGVVLLRSNVAPLVVRAERWELWKLADADAQARRQVELQVVIPEQ